MNAAGLGWTLHNDICLPYFLTLCTEEQKARWLPGICSGELITAIAMTEPGIGSDLASMSTSAILDGDHYVVNGSKTFITNGINADLVVTAVKTDPSQRHAGMSLMILERGMQGFERGRNLEKIGMHAQDTAELFFNDVPVPVDEPAGGGGQRVPLAGRQAAPGAAVDRGHRRRRGARRRSTLTLEYTKERTAFGQPIGSFQNSRFKLAEMATEIEIAQTFVDRCVLALNERRAHRRGSGDGEVVVHRAAEARRSTRACSCTAATATWPSTRSPAPTPTPRITTIYGGTTEIMKEIIGRSLGV